MRFFRYLRDRWLAYKNRPCDCHGCMPVETNNSRSPYVSHGLELWIDKDGKTHFRKKSRYRSTF